MQEPSRFRDTKDVEDNFLDGILSQGVTPESDYYAAEIRKVLSDPESELDSEFLGFTSSYRHLSMIIPLHFTVIDFGCNHSCQAFYFKDHKKYIGIDSHTPIEYRLRVPNDEHWLSDGREFLNSIQWNDSLAKNYPIFAISNYVPSEELNILIRARFKDLYIFYPKSKMPNRD